MNILNEKELAKIYLEISLSPLSLDEESLSFYISQSRHDPRLAEIVTEHIRDFWWRYEESSLNKSLKKQEFPNAILVMIEQISTLTNLDISTKDNFISWAKGVSKEIYPPKVKELYFIKYC